MKLKTQSLSNKVLPLQVSCSYMLCNCQAWSQPRWFNSKKVDKTRNLMNLPPYIILQWFHTSHHQTSTSIHLSLYIIANSHAIGFYLLKNKKNLQCKMTTKVVHIQLYNNWIASGMWHFFFCWRSKKLWHKETQRYSTFCYFDNKNKNWNVRI